jgi:hypothetical protein
MTEVNLRGVKITRADLSMANCYFAKPHGMQPLLHPFLYVIDSKRALSFGETRPNLFMRTAPKLLCAFLLPNETKSAEVLPAVPPRNYH